MITILWHALHGIYSAEYLLPKVLMLSQKPWKLWVLYGQPTGRKERTTKLDIIKFLYTQIILNDLFFVTCSYCII